MTERRGCLPGMYAPLNPRKNRRNHNRPTNNPNTTQYYTRNGKQMQQQVLSFNKQDVASKPPIFDYLASFQQTPAIPAHLTAQSKLVLQRRGQRRKRGQGKLDKGWFTDANQLIKAPFHTSHNTRAGERPQQYNNDGSEINNSIMANIVEQHPPLYETPSHLKLPYTELRQVVGLGLEPLDFPKRSLD